MVDLWRSSMSFKVRKWIYPPVIAEVIGRFETEEEVREFIREMVWDNYMTPEEIMEKIEVEEE